MFNAEGKLVTSLRMRSDELEKKVRKGRWKPMKAKEVKAYGHKSRSLEP